jgi:hypothetical protein
MLVAPITGWYTPVKLPSPITASVVIAGIPAVQFEAVAQLLLVIPVQLVCAKERLPVRIADKVSRKRIWRGMQGKDLANKMVIVDDIHALKKICI